MVATSVPYRLPVEDVVQPPAVLTLLEIRHDRKQIAREEFGAVVAIRVERRVIVAAGPSLVSQNDTEIRRNSAARHVNVVADERPARPTGHDDDEGGVQRSTRPKSIGQLEGLAVGRIVIDRNPNVVDTRPGAVRPRRAEQRHGKKCQTTHTGRNGGPSDRVHISLYG